MPKASKATYKTVAPTRVKNSTKKNSISKPSRSMVASTANSSVAGDTEPADSVMDIDDRSSLAESHPGTEIVDSSSDEDGDPQTKLGMCSVSPVHCVLNKSSLDRLRKTWRSPIYNFFKPNVTIQHHNDRLCHFFACAARSCKSSAGGVRRYQDSKDKASTANLKAHAIKCFGEEAVKIATGAKDVEIRTSQSIFAAFARQGQVPRNSSLHPHTNLQARAQIIKWVTENNRPINIINDRALRDLLTAGRPHLALPG
jgi:hypothetical protein